MESERPFDGFDKLTTGKLRETEPGRLQDGTAGFQQCFQMG